MSLSGRPERDRTEADIAELVIFVRETKNESAFRELVNYLDSYIKLFGKKYTIPGCDADEIEQECLCALWTKAIEDFDPKRGKFKSFAILCIKRHLFSLIKGNNQLKRRVLNQSVSLEEDRSTNGDGLSLSNLVCEDAAPVDDALDRKESFHLQKNKLLAESSEFEQEVLKLYIQQMRYEEIVEELRKIFPKKRINIKCVDNSLVRLRSKAKLLGAQMGWDNSNTDTSRRKKSKKSRAVAKKTPRKTRKKSSNT